MGNVNSLLINTYLNEVKMSNVGSKVPMRLGMWFSLLPRYLVMPNRLLPD